jgi:hypothetical protein
MRRVFGPRSIIARSRARRGPNTPEPGAPEEPAETAAPGVRLVEPEPLPEQVAVVPEPEPELEVAPAPESGESAPEPMRVLQPVPDPEPEGREPELEPEPVASVVAIGVSAEPRQWNVWDLEKLARDHQTGDAAQDEERSFLLMYLREFAGPDGVLPADFDALVRDSFGELMWAR